MILEFKNSFYNTTAMDYNQNAEIGFLNQIILRPNRFYCQKLPFLTDDEYSVFVADICGNNIQDITDDCYFSLNFIEFGTTTDFEAETVILKIVNNINPNDVWFSNPLFFTDSFFSLSIDYKNVADNYMQSCGVNAYFTRATQENNVSLYVQESGVKVSGKSTLTEMRKYLFEYLDNLVYRRLNLALTNTIVYLDLIKITDKPLLKDGDIDGSQNTFKSELLASVDYNQQLTRVNQFAPALELISYYPNSYYTLTTIENKITLVFNKEITDVSGSIIKLYKDGIFYSNLDLIQINITTFEQTYNFTENGEYEIRVESGKFKSSLYGEVGALILPFVIADGGYSNLHYNSNHYFIN